MASASSGRYQSRLFNFVHQQSRRVTEQCVRAFRHLQVTTSWGVQVLLYPVYLLFQSTGLAEKQMHSSVQESWFQLQADDTDSHAQSPPTADTPIQRVLLLVDVPSEEAVSSPSQNGSLTGEFFFRQLPPKPTNFLAFLASWRFKISPSPHLPISPSPHLPISPSADKPRRNRPVVQGIATQLSTRTLVLVTAQNEILDILTGQQQEKLQKRIIGEVANYWSYQRLAHRGRQEKLLAPPALPALFPYQALAFLDRTVAELESSSLAPLSEVAITLGKRSWEIVHLVQTQLSVLLSSKLQPAGSKSAAIAPNGNDAHTLRIQALIWAAINYFFGRRTWNLGQTMPKNDSLELPDGATQGKRLPHRRSNSKLPSAHLTSVDPWLTLSELFGDPTEEGEDAICYKPESSTSQTTNQHAGKTNLALPSNQSGGYSLQNLLNLFRKVFGLRFQFLPKPKQASGLVQRHGSLAEEKFSHQVPQKTTRSVTRRKTAQKIAIAGAKPGAIASPTPVASPSITTPSPLSQPPSVSAGESNQHGGQSTQIDPAPDWIETQATAMGYVKHPLEQLLEWVDRAMLWLEKVLMSVLQWVQQIWRVDVLPTLSEVEARDSQDHSLRFLFPRLLTRLASLSDRLRRHFSL